MNAELDSYLNEYNDIIAQISYVCKIISKNQKSYSGPDDIEELVAVLCPRIYDLASDYKNQS